MTNEKAIMCLEDMKIKVPIPKAAKQARENNEALDVAIKALAESELSTNLAEVGTDCISRQAAIDALDEQIEQCDKSLSSFDISLKDEYAVKVERASLVAFRETLEYLPHAEPEHTCVNCGRTVNNGGWYADGRTRCPIEEHYALPKDGFCHLWEKRNVTDDDYPERRTDG